MDARIEVNTAGLDRMLGTMRTRVDVIGRNACADTADAVARKTRQSVPHRSGRLAASVSAVTTADGAVVTMTAPYAAWIEYGGTRGRARVPEGRYLGPALEGADKKTADAAERQIEREARSW